LSAIIHREQSAVRLNREKKVKGFALWEL